MGMTIEEAKVLPSFLCSGCGSEGDANNSFPVPAPSTEVKVEP